MYLFLSQVSFIFNNDLMAIVNENKVQIIDVN